MGTDRRAVGDGMGRLLVVADEQHVEGGGGGVVWFWCLVGMGMVVGV